MLAGFNPASTVPQTNERLPARSSYFLASRVPLLSSSDRRLRARSATGLRSAHPPLISYYLFLCRREPDACSSRRDRSLRSAGSNLREPVERGPEVHRFRSTSFCNAYPRTPELPVCLLSDARTASGSGPTHCPSSRQAHPHEDSR